MSRPSRVARSLLRGAVVAALAVTAAGVAGVVTSDGSRTVQAQQGGELGAGGEYHAVTPARILDTREPPPLDVAPLGRKPISATDTGPAVFDVPIVGMGGLPDFQDADGDGNDDRVLAVAVNVTVATPTHEGWLRAFGKDAPEGMTSVVNFKAGQTVPNNAILRPGTDGKITVRVVGTGAGSLDVIIDVFGWWSSSGYSENGARLIPAGPGRIYDSREQPFGARTIKGGETVKVPIRGANSFSPNLPGIVPDDPNVVGVMINLTGVNFHPGSRGTHFSVVPAHPGTTPPPTSNLNLVPGQVRASTSIVPVHDGSIYVYNLAGESDIVIDVVAYLVKGFPATSREGRVVPLVAPFRAFDTREPAHHKMPLGPARAEDWSFQAFTNDVKVGTQQVGAQLGLIGNLTATGLTRQYDWAPVETYLTAFPTPSSNSVPTVSNINIVEGSTVPNLALLRYSEGTNPQVRFYNRAGYLDYLLDVSAVILADPPA